MTMRVGDLNPSLEMDSRHGAETVSSYPPFTGRFSAQRPIIPGGEKRQAEGQTGLPTLERGAATLVARAQAPARDPPWTEDRTRDFGAGLPSHFEPEPIPKQPARPQTKGEAIGLKWHEEEEEDEEPVTEMSLADEEGLLSLTIGRLLEEHFVGLEGLNDLCVRRALWVAKQDHQGATHLVDMQEDYRSQGPLKVMLREAVSSNTPQLSLLEFVAGRGRDAVDDFKLYLASKQVEYSWEGIVSLMNEATRLLPLVQGDLERSLGTEVWKATWRRHLQLEEGLSAGRGEISRETAQLFPRATAGDILQWYTRLVAGMMVMVTEGQRFKRTTAAMAEFMDGYPGPDLPIVSHQQQEQEGWRGSLQKRLLGDDSISRYHSHVEEVESQRGDENPRQEMTQMRTEMASGGASQRGKGKLHPRSEESLQAERDRTIEQAGEAGMDYRVGGAAPMHRDEGFIGESQFRGQPVNLLEGGQVRSRNAQDLDRERQQSYADEYLKREGDRARILEEGSRGGSSRSSSMMGLKSTTRPLMEGMVEDLEEYERVDGFENLNRSELEASIRTMVVQKLKHW